MCGCDLIFVAACAVSGAIYGVLLWFTGCPCIYSCLYRNKMRKQLMFEDRPCNDCLVHFCCDACALCQEYRELKHRGFDMTMGKLLGCSFPYLFNDR
jgi:Cys-rich protein (TIGR01571 family)